MLNLGALGDVQKSKEALKDVTFDADVTQVHHTPPFRARIFIELMMSDRKPEASREGSK
jgi:hypothetical protein